MSTFPYRLRHNTVIRIRCDWDLWKLRRVITEWLVVDDVDVYVVPPSHEALCARPEAFGRLIRNSNSVYTRILIVDEDMRIDLHRFNILLWGHFRRDMIAQCPACGTFNFND